MIPVILQPPSDGFTNLEIAFIKDILLSIYKSIDDPITRFIIMAHFECGYTQDQISSVIGLSQPTVVQRIRKTQGKLRRMKCYGKL